jgi:PAS domain S-box-containing protein
MLQITAGGAAFRQFGAQRANLVRMYLSLAAAILLATAFVATWIGFYLSRRITVPMEEVAAAAREISSGNLGVRVVADQGDEVGMLVEAFNDMAAQLQESREVITRSTADLRRSNQALDERRRYIETLVANLSTAVVSLDREGRISTANPAAEEILGIGLPPGEELARLLEGEGLATLREFVTQPVPRAGEIRRSDLVLTPRGESMTVSAHLTALRGPSQRETQGLLIMLEDLTELMRAQRMAAWSEVARRMAHDIKNPLTPIQLAAQRLRKKFDESAPDFPDVLTDATASIEHEVAVLKGLVDEFSRFARMPEVVLRLVDFAGIVDSVVALYQGLPGVRWEVEVESGMPQVQVDPEQMRRVLVNLIDNAVAAMSGEGSVRIAVRAGSGPGSLRLEVADTGPGILPGDRSKLFLPYFSTKRRGTGLGLAIVHRIISDHLGTIRAEDNRPRGARFVIEIPG